MLSKYNRSGYNFNDQEIIFDNSFLLNYSEELLISWNFFKTITIQKNYQSKKLNKKFSIKLNGKIIIYEEI